LARSKLYFSLFYCSTIGVGEGGSRGTPPAWKLSGQIWNIFG